MRENTLTIPCERETDNCRACENKIKVISKCWKVLSSARGHQYASISSQLLLLLIVAVCGWPGVVCLGVSGANITIIRAIIVS